MKLLISKREETINVRKVNNFKAKLKKFGAVVSLLKNNNRQPNHNSQKHEFCSLFILPYHDRGFLGRMTAGAA